MMAVGFSQAILDWARTKPADEPYDYCSQGNCAIAQFLRETGRASDPRVVMNRWRDGALAATSHTFDDRVRSAANDAMGLYEATMGGFADRLEKALSA